MVITKILVVSDNHGKLNAIKEIIQNNNYDYVLHAGDFCCNLVELKKLHPRMFVVLGNNDDSDNFLDDVTLQNATYDANNNLLSFKIDNVNFGMIHGHFCLGWNPKNYLTNLVNFAKKHAFQCLVFGHTHIPFYEKIGGIEILNPGSIEYPRGADFKQTYAEIIICEGKIKVNFLVYKSSVYKRSFFSN